MTLTLQRRPCSRSREKRGLRLLGTVPETDVLVVTHKRNVHSKDFGIWTRFAQNPDGFRVSVPAAAGFRGVTLVGKGGCYTDCCKLGAIENEIEHNKPAIVVARLAAQASTAH